MEYTTHTLLAGGGAEAFATTLGGLPDTNLSGAHSIQQYESWLGSDCQPNYYSDEVVGANNSCGPYSPRSLISPTPLPSSLVADVSRSESLAAARKLERPHRNRAWATPSDHDTLGLCALDAAGSLTAAVTSNGASHKVAGRVGDAPVVGAGGYASDSARGCAACTGDGDITQRFLPSFVATENMRRGMKPLAACEDAVRRIMEHVSDFSIGIVCLNSDGEFAAAAHGWGGDGFKYCAASPAVSNGQVVCSNVQSLTA